MPTDDKNVPNEDERIDWEPMLHAIRIANRCMIAAFHPKPVNVAHERRVRGIIEE